MQEYTNYISNIITSTIDTLGECAFWGSNLFAYLVALIFVGIVAERVVKRY